MANCCLNKIGIFPHNEEIKTGIIVDQDGTYRLHMAAANSNTFILNKELTVGSEITFPIGQLNENMAYKFTIEQPDESFYKENDCDLFGIRTIINTQLDGCENTCDDDSNTNNYYS